MVKHTRQRKQVHITDLARPTFIGRPHEIIIDIERSVMRYTQQGYTNIRFEREYGVTSVIGERLETDLEHNERIQREKYKKVRQTKAAKTKEVKERKELTRLKKKYPGE